MIPMDSLWQQIGGNPHKYRVEIGGTISSIVDKIWAVLIARGLGSSLKGRVPDYAVWAPDESSAMVEARVQTDMLTEFECIKAVANGFPCLVLPTRLQVGNSRFVVSTRVHQARDLVHILLLRLHGANAHAR